MPSTRAAENDARRGTALLGSLLSSGESSDVIQHVLTQLLDSAKRSGGYGDRGKCPITKKHGDEFVRELEEKLGGYRVSVPSGYDEEDDDVKLEQTLYDVIFGGT